MKLLLDQNLSRKVIPHIEGQFPGSAHVLLRGLARSTDSDIWYYARLHGYTIVTKNNDMVDLCVLRGAPPKVIWVRVGNCSTNLILEVLTSNADQIASFEADAAVVLSLFRFRITPPA